MTYGLKKGSGNTTKIMANGMEFKHNSIVGVGAYQPKEYKSLKSATKKAEQIGAEVFNITETGVMEY